MAYENDIQASMTRAKTAVIIGAGPAGLTAAYELADSETDIRPIVLEASEHIGGLCRTVIHNGLRIDIGGHRFFSKSDTINNWWKAIFDFDGDPNSRDDVFMTRPRISHILYKSRYIDYPIKPTWNTLRKIGIKDALRSGTSYLSAKIRPRKPEATLEDFYINHFGRTLYRLFFEDYTTKVWGKRPSELGADWGSQRVKGLSISTLIKGMLSEVVGRKKDDKKIETSLIESFKYPKYGPGQFWEAVAKKIQMRGGQITTNCKVHSIDIHPDDKCPISVSFTDSEGKCQSIGCDYVLSSMPLSELFNAIKGVDIPDNIRTKALELPYRDFITIGILIDERNIHRLRDTWIYIQDRRVRLGRLQVYNNWSPYLVPGKGIWLGLEYFCAQSDDLWKMSDDRMTEMAVNELRTIGIIADDSDILDSIVIRVPKAYPAYYGTYDAMPEIRTFVDSIDRLYCIGRNGQHRYNNMDHSMLTAITAVNAIKGLCAKDEIWKINTENTYHEEKINK